METLDKHFRNLAKAAFAHHGFASEQLISQWAIIVGQPWASYSVPDKINWPRSASDMTRKLGGTLVIRAAAGRALELQYEGPRLIERVNQFLGYGAITSLKIKQDSLRVEQPKQLPRPMSSQARQAWHTQIDDIADNPLKAALSRLAAHAAPNGPKPKMFSTGENRDWPLYSNSDRKIP